VYQSPSFNHTVNISFTITVGWITTTRSALTTPSYAKGASSKVNTQKTPDVETLE
jgi:hypothetical protein